MRAVTGGVGSNRDAFQSLLKHVGCLVESGQWRDALTAANDIPALINRLVDDMIEARLRDALAARRTLTVAECLDLLDITTHRERHVFNRRLPRILVRMGCAKIRIPNNEQHDLPRWCYGISPNEAPPGKSLSAVPERPMKTYFVRCNGLVKIGRSSDIDSRLKALRTASPHDLEILAVVDEDVERKAHKHFRAHRVQREWFRITQHDVVRFIYDHTTHRQQQFQLSIAG